MKMMQPYALRRWEVSELKIGNLHETAFFPSKAQAVEFCRKIAAEDELTNSHRTLRLAKAYNVILT